MLRTDPICTQSIPHQRRNDFDCVPTTDLPYSQQRKHAQSKAKFALG